MEIPGHFGPYDPRIGLFCHARFNKPIEKGLVWFQTYPKEEKVTVHFHPKLYDDQDMDEEVDRVFDNKEIRRPDAAADPAFPADSEITDDQKVSFLLLWPPKIVFDLLRLVLAPSRRQKQEAEDVKQSMKRAREERRIKKESSKAAEEPEESVESGEEGQAPPPAEDENEGEERTTRKRGRRGGQRAKLTRSRGRGQGKQGRK